MLCLRSIGVLDHTPEREPAMANDAAPTEPPTFFANIVTVSVDPDVVYVELRRYIVPHASLHKSARVAPPTSPPTDEAIYAEAPIARVVLTYAAARALQNNLNEMIPKMQNARKETQDR